MQGKTTTTKATGGKAGGKAGGGPPDLDNWTEAEAAKRLAQLGSDRAKAKLKLTAIDREMADISKRFPSAAQKAAARSGTAGGGVLGNTKGAGKPAGAGAR